MAVCVHTCSAVKDSATAAKAAAHYMAAGTSQANGGMPVDRACMQLQDIPRLEWSQRNEARRLVTLIDTLYDMRCRLECSAAGKPQQVPVCVQPKCA